MPITGEPLNAIVYVADVAGLRKWVGRNARTLAAEALILCALGVGSWWTFERATAAPDSTAIFESPSPYFDVDWHFKVGASVGLKDVAVEFALSGPHQLDIDVTRFSTTDDGRPAKGDAGYVVILIPGGLEPRVDYASDDASYGLVALPDRPGCGPDDAYGEPNPCNKPDLLLVAGPGEDGGFQLTIGSDHLGSSGGGIYYLSMPRVLCDSFGPPLGYLPFEENELPSAAFDTGCPGADATVKVVVKDEENRPMVNRQVFGEISAVELGSRSASIVGSWNSNVSTPTLSLRYEVESERHERDVYLLLCGVVAGCFAAVLVSSITRLVSADGSTDRLLDIEAKLDEALQSASGQRASSTTVEPLQPTGPEPHHVTPTLSRTTWEPPTTMPVPGPPVGSSGT